MIIAQTKVKKREEMIRHGSVIRMRKMVIYNSYNNNNNSYLVLALLQYSPSSEQKVSKIETIGETYLSSRPGMNSSRTDGKRSIR